MGNQMTFVEKAREEAIASPIHAGDETANRLLASAREKIYHWPSEFEGFTAKLTYLRDGESWSGELVAKDSQHFKQSWDREFERENRIWMNYQLGELLAHREAPERSRMASRTGVLLGDADPVFGRQVIFPEDPMGSYYRLSGDKITQIARSYPKSDFIINIDTHHCFDGRYAAHCYNVFYWSRENGEFKKTETYVDSYQEVEGVYLPSSRRYTMASSKGLSNRDLIMTEHKLLGRGVTVPSAAPLKCPFH